jgi:hypothetical protein
MLVKWLTLILISLTVSTVGIFCAYTQQSPKTRQPITRIAVTDVSFADEEQLTN